MRAVTLDKKQIETNEFRNHLNWNINDSDFYYYSKYLKRLASFLKLNQLCSDFTISNEATLNLNIPQNVHGGSHHMSTLSFGGKDSFINSNFQHIGFKNLYFVGSSSFPISGYENPTHTAIATALAAVDHLNKNE